MTRRRRLSLGVAAALAVPALFTTACSGHDSGAAPGGTRPAATSSPSAGAPSGSSADQLQQMQQKVNAAQSAADAADQDAKSD
ncbi:hypothetical protein [Streptomyces sp. ICBB 8177]|uniref:hypothetical protein n=1 Tax=Streptomyces sp. ICBB 8177 TaxID=563922 RepID=UPI000D675D0B|nr:hypothetical protein [Streptomyces sp. ICBB 8177]PWI41922.1 hypothetical protein CK485_24345 [Streptomyces sp. ICBB 8177]